MRRTLTLHIGTPKSGTTHLQAILHPGRGRLRRQGVLYPGAGCLPRDGFNQQPAIYALAGSTIGWIDDEDRATAGVYFGRLCEEVSAHPGRVLISAESLAFFETAQAQALLERLGFDPAAVTVVITARDYGRLLPSVWQQNVKNGSVEGLEPYLESVAALRDRPDVPFWTAFGLPELVQRWARIVGPDRIVLVTAPPPGADKDILWSRYATASALPQALMGHAAGRIRADDNVSLTPSQVELVRRMNVVMQAAGYTKDTQQRLRGRLLQIWMNTPRPRRHHLVLPEHLHEAVQRWAEEDILLLRRLDVPVVGALADLAPALPPSTLPPGPGAVAGTMDLETVRDVLDLVEHAPVALARPDRPGPGRARWRTRVARLVGPILSGRPIPALGRGASVVAAPQTRGAVRRPVPRIDLASTEETTSAQRGDAGSPPRR